jgi:hypothetical protein
LCQSFAFIGGRSLAVDDRGHFGEIHAIRVVASGNYG